MILLGEDEIARREATLKELTGGEQVTVPRSELAGRLASAVDAATGVKERS